MYNHSFSEDLLEGFSFKERFSFSGDTSPYFIYCRRPSKTLRRQRLLRADDNVRSTLRKQQTFYSISDKMNSWAY